MAYAFELFAHHGLLTLFLAVLIEQLGAPIPALPFLLLAGVAAAGNAALAAESVMVASTAALIANVVWFHAGQRLGRRVLILLCRISISPDSCVRQSEVSFARRGPATLVIAKFVPGLATMASPLAGAIGMRFPAFLGFTLAGSLLWAGSGIAVGMVFHAQVGSILDAIGRLGNAAFAAAGALLAAYVAFRAVRRARARFRLAGLPRILPEELAGAIALQEDLLIIDVRAVMLPLRRPEKLPSAQYIELAELAQADPAPWRERTRIITYCDCPNDATALKAAELLRARGLPVWVLKGGIDAWARAGFALESSRGEQVDPAAVGDFQQGLGDARREPSMDALDPQNQ